MDYIAEDTAFERWCENNYLPILSQAIWKKLFKRFNRSGWSEWVTVDNLTLMSEVQIRREGTFIEHRDRLIEAGLLEYIKGKKGSPNKYRLIPLSQKCTFTSAVYNGVQSVVHSEVEPVVQSVVQTADITKQNKTKPNKTKKENNARKRAPLFQKPTVDEIKAYCDERDNDINPQQFFDFYESKGWMVGNNAMKDWKAAVRTWETRGDDVRGSSKHLDGRLTHRNNYTHEQLYAGLVTFEEDEEKPC